MMIHRWTEALADKPYWDWTLAERLLNMLGLRRQVEYELTERFEVNTSPPDWATPIPAGVWQARRKRFVWQGIPLSWWYTVRASGA